MGLASIIKSGNFYADGRKKDEENSMASLIKSGNFYNQNVTSTVDTLNTVNNDLKQTITQPGLSDLATSLNKGLNQISNVADNAIKEAKQLQEEKEKQNLLNYNDYIKEWRKNQNPEIKQANENEYKNQVSKLYNELITGSSTEDRQTRINEYNLRVNELKKQYGIEDKKQVPTKDKPVYFYNHNGKLYKEELVSSKENGKEDTYTYKTSPVDSLLEQDMVLNSPGIKIERRNDTPDTLQQFRDGYQFGDATKTLTNLVTDKFVEPGETVIDNFAKDPLGTAQAFGTGTISGIDKSTESVGRFLNEVTGNKKEQQAPYSVVDMNVGDFNRLQKKTPEEKQLYLNQLEKDYKDGKLSDKMYQLAKLALTKEDTRTDVAKWIDENLFSPDYKETEAYQKHSTGKMNDAEQNVWNAGENLGMQIPSMALSSMYTPAVGTGYFWAQASQNYTEEARQRGYSDKDARKYGIIMGSVEAAIERMGFDELGGLKSMADDSLIKAIGGEMMEEFATPWVDYGVRTFFGEDYNTDAALNEAIDGAVMAAVTSAIMSAGSKGLVKVDNIINKTNNGQQVTQQELADAAKELQQNDPNLIKDKVNKYLTALKEDGSLENYHDVQIYNQIQQNQEIQQDIEEVEKQDIKDTVDALNLEEEIQEEQQEEQEEATPTTTELELNLENQTQNQTQNNINITTGLEDYIKNNNLTELTQENIDDYINQILEEQQANLTEQERKSLIDEYQDIIKDYAKDNGIPVIEAPKIEIPDMTAESKAPSKAIGRETRNEIKNQVNAFNRAVKSDQYKVGNQVKEQYKNLEQKSINKLDNDALFYNVQEQKKNISRKAQEPSARREYVQPVVQRKADVSTTIGQNYGRISNNQNSKPITKNGRVLTEELESLYRRSKAQIQDENAKGTPFNTTVRVGDKNALIQVKGDVQTIDGVEVGIYKDSNGNWHVIDTKSNLALDRDGYKTKKDALDNAKNVIENFDLSKLRENGKKNTAKAVDLTDLTLEDFEGEYDEKGNIYPIKQEIENNQNIEYNKMEIGETKNIPINQTSSLLSNNGGRYMSTEEYNKLKSDIEKNGIKEPIEIYKDENGNFAIEQGNHRLQIAKEIGLKEVPIKMVESWESLLDKKPSNISNEIEEVYNDKTSKRNSGIDEISRDTNGMLQESNGISNNTRTTKENVRVSKKESNNIKQTSDVKNKGNSRELDNSSFSLKQENTRTDLDALTGRKPTNKVNDISKQETPKKTPKNPITDNVKAMNLEKETKKVEKPKKQRDNLAETKKDEVVQLKTDKGKKIDLKKTSDNIYERVETPKKTDVMPDMSDDTVTVGDKKVSNFYSNITEKSKFITEENRASLQDNENLKYYNAITNKDTLLDAMDKLDKNAEQQIGDFFAKDSFNAEDMATGWILVKRYQDAGNYEAMSNVIETMRDKGTKSGQAIQMLGMLDRLTPEGMEFYAQRQLDNAYNKFVENKSKKEIDKYAEDFTLTPEEHQFIKDTMEKVEKMTNEDDKKVEVAKIVKMLSDKLPPEKGSRIKAWMRISMLGNPKTQVRNVVGNAIIQPFNWLGDTVASRIDKIMSKKTGIRTKGNTDFGALAGGFVKGAKEAVRDAKLGIDTRDINLNRFEENIGAKPFYEGHKSKALNVGAKVLNKTNQILGNVMSGGDRVFYQAIYDNSLKNQMKLNNVTTPTQEMMQIAEQEALSRTWNDSNEYTKAVLQIRNAMNKLNVKGYGLGDVLVPFAKTPANLTKAIVDYSPVGLVRSILQDGKNYRNSLQNGQFNAQIQHKFADSLGKGFAGTVLWAAAYALAQAGITSGASDDDKDVANFMRNTLGIQPYSIKIGDKSFTYDWAQPIAAPFAIMADAKRLSEKEEKDFGSIVKTAVSSASNILLEQSFLSSIQDVFNSYEGPAAAIKQQIEDLPARATPTFFKQIADLIDPVQRQTYVKGNTGETVKNKVQVKIPGASKELTAQRDTLGREIKKYGGDDNIAQYAFNVFLNPANTNKGKPSAAAEEIYDVYKNTGDKTVMPRQVGYSENVGGTTIPLSAEERNEWQRLSGEKIEESVKALTSNSKYNSMSYEDKADVINGIVNYSFAKAKSDMFGTQISTQYKTASKKEAEGIPIADYYVDRISKRK